MGYVKKPLKLQFKMEVYEETLPPHSMRPCAVAVSAELVGISGLVREPRNCKVVFTVFGELIREVEAAAARHHMLLMESTGWRVVAVASVMSGSTPVDAFMFAKELLSIASGLDAAGIDDAVIGGDATSAAEEGILLGRKHDSSKEDVCRIQFQVGISSSPVVCGDLGVLRPQRVCVGKCLYRSSELRSLAAPSSVLVDEAAYSLVEGHFDFHEHGMLCFPDTSGDKGFTEVKLG